jgi:hypothetical protein
LRNWNQASVGSFPGRSPMRMVNSSSFSSNRSIRSRIATTAIAEATATSGSAPLCWARTRTSK